MGSVQALLKSQNQYENQVFAFEQSQCSLVIFRCLEKGNWLPHAKQRILLPMQEAPETWVQSLDWEDTLEWGMATYSSILAWQIPWTEEPDGLQSMGWQRVGHDWAQHTHSINSASVTWKCLYYVLGYWCGCFKCDQINNTKTKEAVSYLQVGVWRVEGSGVKTDVPSIQESSDLAPEFASSQEVWKGWAASF